MRQREAIEDLRDALRHSSHEADRLSQLAEDLLLIARRDRKRLPLQLDDLAVDELFASLVSRFDWRRAGGGNTDARRPGPRLASAATGADSSRASRT
jgi:signal transduction histidine kinase